MKMLIRDTNEIKEMKKVGDNLWLDESNNDIYHSEEVMPVREHEIDASELVNLLNNIKEAKQANQEGLYVAFRSAATMETIKKRPFIGKRQLAKRIDNYCEIAFDKKQLKNI